MPRFYKKKVARAPKRAYKPRAPRRRLGVGTTAVALYPSAVKVARAGYSVYKGYKKAQYAKRRQQVDTTLLASDNITTMKATIIGKPRKPTFDEKVSRVERPPILFKRNYQFSAEVSSGRKGWFSFEFNINNTNDLGTDLTTYKTNQYTDNASDVTIGATTNNGDSAKFYVDYLSEKIQFMNSGTASLIGKVHLFCHKRDNDNNYSNAPITPINLMMFYSTMRVTNGVANPNLENTVGNGWKFDTTTAQLNYTSIYNMPGSSINTSGVTALTDLTLSPSSPHIAESLGFWFRKVDTFPFNLKPGQQFNKSYIFNDLADIMREQLDLPHLAGISYSCVVEFQGQMGGSGVVTSGDGVISTVPAQLSIMRESKRIIGIKNKLKSKVLLQTAPPSVISSGAERVINADTSGETLGISFDV